MRSINVIQIAALTAGVLATMPHLILVERDRISVKQILDAIEPVEVGLGNATNMQPNQVLQLNLPKIPQKTAKKLALVSWFIGLVSTDRNELLCLDPSTLSLQLPNSTESLPLKPANVALYGYSSSCSPSGYTFDSFGKQTVSLRFHSQVPEVAERRVLIIAPYSRKTVKDMIVGAELESRVSRLYALLAGMGVLLLVFTNVFGILRLWSLSTRR